MTRWKVGLSNGENYLEGNFPFEFLNGKPSPWLRLVEYLKTNQVSITSLQLESGTRVFHLPSSGSDPRFDAFSDAEKPLAYNWFKVIGGDLRPGDPMGVFIVIEAIYSTHHLQLWVNENNPNHCWVLTKVV